METMEKVVYLDNAATTACAPEVLAVMTQALSGACGNPSSHYSVGYEAKEFVDTGRAQVAKAINASPAEIFFTGCGSEADNWAVKGTAFTKARQNKKHLITSAGKAQAVDVREPDEFAVGHIPGAKLLPLGDVLTRAEEVMPDKNAQWLIYCRTGRRSADAAQKLEAQGYTGLRDLGGILSWPYEIEGDFEGHF